MMRRVSSVSVAMASVAGARSLAGRAPVLHFPSSEPAALTKDQQIAKNTTIAVGLIKRFKGAAPAPYVRKSTQTVDQLEKEIEALLGGAEKLRKKATDDQPMDKLTLMERCLRHALWSYYKDEGSQNFEAMAKWIVYTPNDEIRFSQLKRESEAKAKYADFRRRRAEAGLPDAPLPKAAWAAEYAAATDREVVAEKRVRYDALAANTTARNDAAIDDVLKTYRQPVQLKRLDELAALLERFKPVLAREAIMQRLTIKHLEGQLGVWRYLDWNPEVRDRAELEVDNNGMQWWSPLEERRLLQVRLRSKNEVREVMEKAQAAEQVAFDAANPNASKGGAVAGAGNSARDKMLKEVLALQARLNKREDEGQAAKPAEAKKGHH